MAIRLRRVPSWLGLVLIASAQLAPAAPDAAAEQLAKLPPLIDREVFFGNPEISGAAISPDGQWISFRRPHREVMNIWVKAIDAPFEAARPVTADTERPVGGHFWTEDSRYLLYVQDKGGDEDFHIYAVDPAADADPATGVPTARDLTPLDGIRAFIYAVPEATPAHIIVGINDRDPALHDVYRLDIATGDRQLVIRNDSNVASWTTDLAGDVRLAVRQRADGGNEILVVDEGKLGRVLIECSFEETCEPLRFHKDGKRVYVESNVGVDLTRLTLVTVANGRTKVVEADPDGEVDFGSAWFSDVTEELVATVYVGDRERIYPRTRALRRELRRLRRDLPDGEIRYRSASEDESKVLISVASDVNPGSVYLYDRATRKLEKLYDSRPELPSEHLAPMQAIRYKAHDGREIPAYLVTPKNVEARRLPTVVVPHGGPWARDVWGYDPLAQFLANRGYAVLLPNFRGSTGYGKEFLNAGNGEWGTGFMQHDITDGVIHLLEIGVADASRLAIMGGSYGGYATLAGLAFTDDFYAAGVSIVGPSNIITLLNSIPPYWGPIKQMFMLRVGDPEADRERLIAQSPFFHAENIEAPLLVIQGANDPRVKQAESDQIVAVLRDLGQQVDYLVAPDEGHGFAGQVNRLAMYAAIERFLARHLGGREQSDMAPAVAERLQALTVDVADVRIPKEALESARPRLDGSELTEATYAYDLKLDMPDRLIEVASTVAWAKATRNDQEVWRVTTTNESELGTSVDTLYLGAADLRPLYRTIEEGPLRLALDYAIDVIKGTVTMPEDEQVPIDVPLNRPVVGHLETALSVMPIEPGFDVRLRNFDPMLNKLRHWAVTVVDAETVTTPTGSIDAYRVELRDAEDSAGEPGIYWLSQTAPHRIVKSESTLPTAVGGGSMSLILTSKSGADEP